MCSRSYVSRAHGFDFNFGGGFWSRMLEGSGGWLFLSLLLLLGGGCARCCHRSSESSDKPRAASATAAGGRRCFRSVLRHHARLFAAAWVVLSGDERSKARHPAAETLAKLLVQNYDYNTRFYVSQKPTSRPEHQHDACLWAEE